MREPALFQAPHTFLRQVRSEIGEAAEQDADMLRTDTDPRPSRAVAYLPAALFAEPLDEGCHRVGRTAVDLHIGNIARAVGMRHGQRHDPWLAVGCLDTA